VKTTVTVPDLTTTTTPVPTTPFSCPDDYTAKHPNPDDCHSFYECVAGVAYLVVSFRV
jgi:hypothetical protein